MRLICSGTKLIRGCYKLNAIALGVDILYFVVWVKLVFTRDFIKFTLSCALWLASSYLFKIVAFLIDIRRSYEKQPVEK